MKKEVEQLMATFNAHREDLQKQLVEAQKDKEVMAEFQQTLYVLRFILLLLPFSSCFVCAHDYFHRPWSLLYRVLFLRMYVTIVFSSLQCACIIIFFTCIHSFNM